MFDRLSPAIRGNLAVVFKCAMLVNVPISILAFFFHFHAIVLSDGFDALLLVAWAAMIASAVLLPTSLIGIFTFNRAIHAVRVTCVFLISYSWSFYLFSRIAGLLDFDSAVVPRSLDAADLVQQMLAASLFILWLVYNLKYRAVTASFGMEQTPSSAQSRADDPGDAGRTALTRRGSRAAILRYGVFINIPLALFIFVNGLRTVQAYPAQWDYMAALSRESGYQIGGFVGMIPRSELIFECSLMAISTIFLICTIIAPWFDARIPDRVRVFCASLLFYFISLNIIRGFTLLETGWFSNVFEWPTLIFSFSVFEALSFLAFSALLLAYNFRYRALVRPA